MLRGRTGLQPLPQSAILSQKIHKDRGQYDIMTVPSLRSLDLATFSAPLQAEDLTPQLYSLQTDAQVGYDLKKDVR